MCVPTHDKSHLVKLFLTEIFNSNSKNKEERHFNAYILNGFRLLYSIKYIIRVVPIYLGDLIVNASFLNNNIKKVVPFQI